MLFVICAYLGIAFLGGCLYVLYLPLKRYLELRGKLNDSSNKRILVIYISVLFIIGSACAYQMFYPWKYFYKNQFYKNVGFSVPPSSEFLATYYSGPAIRSEYCASAIVRLNSEEFLDLKKRIQNSQAYSIDSFGSDPLYNFQPTKEKEISELAIDEIYTTFNKGIFHIGFMKDQRTIVFEYNNY
jgi:hypothetical protein